MFLQPHKYDTHGPTNLWQADSFIRSGKICNYGYPLEVSNSPIFGVQESKSTLDDSHVIAAKFQYFVCVTTVFWCPKKQKSSPVPVPLISSEGWWNLFDSSLWWVSVQWFGWSRVGGFFQGHTERLEWNSQKFTTNKSHDITSAEPMGDTRLRMEFVDPVNEQYHKSGNGWFQRKG